MVLLLVLTACNPKTTPMASATWQQSTPPTTALPTTPTPDSPLPTATETPAAALLPPPEATGIVIAYTKEGNLWIIQDGQAVQLTRSGTVFTPRISPDGQQIAYLRQADGDHLELWAIHLDGSNERRLVSVADLDTIGATSRSEGSTAITPYHFAWVPGSQIIAFNSRQVFRGPSPTPLDDLNLVDANTGKLTFSLLAGWGGEFVFSPDGRQVAISTPTQIILANPDGGNYRAVFNYEAVNSYSESRFYANPVWAADGSHLLVAIPPIDPLASPPGLTEIWRIPLDGNTPQRINGLDTAPFFDAPVVFSPNAAYLAAVKELGTPAEMRRELRIVKNDGTSSMVYAADMRLNFIAWGLDSLHFFYAAGEDQAMYLGRLDGAPQRLNDHPYGILDPRGLSDRRFVYIQQDGDHFMLCLGAPGAAPRILDTLAEYPWYELVIK